METESPKPRRKTFEHITPEQYKELKTIYALMIQSFNRMGAVYRQIHSSQNRPRKYKPRKPKQTNKGGQYTGADLVPPHAFADPETV